MSDGLDNTESKITKNKYFEGFTKWKEALFFSGVAGMSMLFGFGTSLSRSKKQDPSMFDKGMTPSYSSVEESGATFALRALRRGTMYAVGGCGLLFLSIWMLLGVKDLQEFRIKMGGILPEIPKNNPPQGRTEFENLTDLLQYLIDEDSRLKEEKKIDSSNTLIKETNDSQSIDA